MELRVKKLTETAIIPQVAHFGDLGYDIYSDFTVIFKPNESKLVDTGIALQAPVNIGFFIKDRSSVASKKGLVTHAGVIDAGYQGPIRILFHNITDDHITIKQSEKIAQLVPIKVRALEIQEVVEFPSRTSRGEKGFGSTGDKYKEKKCLYK
ncbi:dUTP diphosphatase [bacterium]|nr:dUTP diphosphatase [bacterium]